MNNIAEIGSSKVKSKLSGKGKRPGVVATPRAQGTPSATHLEMLEAVLKANGKLRGTFSQYFNVPISSLPQLDPSLPPLERNLILSNYVADLYNKHITDLNKRAYNYNNSDNSEINYLTPEEKHEFILKLPKILADINATLREIKKGNPKNIKAVYLTTSMSLVVTAMFRLFDSCITSSKVVPEYLSIIDEAIDFYEQHGEETFCVEFGNNAGRLGYQYRKVYSYTTACILYHTYLNVYLTLKQSGQHVPSEEVFLQHAKKFKRKQIEYVEAVPGEQFVPNPDFRSQYFSLFNYYNALVNFYEKDLNKFVYFLNKMMDAKEDFNIVTANRAFFEKINEALEFDPDLKHHLLLLSLGLKIIDNHFNYYQTLSADRRQSAKFMTDWFYQGMEHVELDELNLPAIGQEYYTPYVETVLELATEQSASLEKLVRQSKLDAFIESVSVQVHSNMERFDVHDVYAELDLKIVDERFVPIILRQLERMNIPCRHSDSLTISIEASFFEIHAKMLKQALHKTKYLCSEAERKHLEQLKREERDKISAAQQLKKEEQQQHAKEKELPRVDEVKEEKSEKVHEKKEKKNEKQKKAGTSDQHEKKSKTRHKEKEKETNFSKQGSFFNPRQPTFAPPAFNTLPQGARLHKLRKPNSPCKYWVCIHPILVHQMIREHKIPELNRLQSQLNEGSLGKGHGVRGIIEGATIKWDDPSRNCRYYGLVAEEHSDSSGKHVLFMLTTKVDEHSKKTPNIIVPPELKEKDSKKLSLG